MLLASADDVPTGIRVLDRREGEDCRSRNQLIEAAYEVAAGLHGLGVEPQERIAIILPTCHEFLEIFFGAQWANTIPVALYAPVRLGRLQEYRAKTVRMLHAIGATKLVTDARCKKLLGRIVADSGIEVVTMVPVLRQSGRANQGLPDMANQGLPDMVDQGLPVPRYRPSPNDVACIQFSSGSTRDPAPVVLTHAQVVANIEAICHEIPDEAYIGGGGCVAWLPLYHDMGLIGCMLTTLRCQRDLTLIPPELFLAKPALWIRAMSKYKAHVTTAPNFAYARCLTHISDQELEGVDLSHWAVAMNGAEPISAHTMRGFADRFAPYGFDPAALLPVYGMSEASLALSFSNALKSERFDRGELAEGRAKVDPDGVELVSVGHALEGFDIQIRHDNAPLDDGEVGHIFGRGPSIMRGYWGRDSPLQDGWLDTGDLGFIHQGELYICGRAKDVLIVAGANHAPQEVEDAVSALDGIREGCVIAVSDIDSDGEHLLVFAEYRDHDDSTANACIQAVRAATGLSVDFVALLEPGTLPRTSSGKLRRQIALQRWKDGTLTPPQKVTPTLMAGEMLKSYWSFWKART